MHIGRGRQHGEHEAKRAGQNMALDPLDLLVAINTALALLRSRHNALRIKDGGGRLGGMAVLLAHRTREHTANVGPDPVVAKPVMPGSNRLPGAKIFGQVAPSAAGLVQIQAGVDHLAQIRRQRLVNRKIRRDCLPLRVRQVAGIAPTVVLVAFAMFRRPHGILLLLHQERAIGRSDRCYTSTTVKQALTWYAMRWAVEPTFQEARRHLGFETQRQWSDLAIHRTTPLLLGLFSLVTLWAADLAAQTGKLAVLGAAWYRKPNPTFADCLAAVRRVLWAEEAVSPILWRDDYPTWRARARTAESARPLQQRLAELMSYAA